MVAVMSFIPHLLHLWPNFAWGGFLWRRVRILAIYLCCGVQGILCDVFLSGMWNYKTNKMDSYCYYSTMRQHVQTLKRCKIFFSAVRIKNLACNSICDLLCSLLKGMGAFFFERQGSICETGAKFHLTTSGTGIYGSLVYVQHITSSTLSTLALVNPTNV